MVSGTGTLSKIIQKFQMKQDPEAGKWNHTGIIVDLPAGIYVQEEAEVKGYALRASVVYTPIEEYLRSDAELLLLTPKNYEADADPRFMRILLSLVGVPYDYRNLLHDQIIRITRGIWVGRKKERARKRMVCHEMTMTAWDDYAGIFENPHQANVIDIFRSPHFDHIPLKGNEQIKYQYQLRSTYISSAKIYTTTDHIIQPPPLGITSKSVNKDGIL